MKKFIKLTRGYYAIIDACDYERVSAMSWHADVRRHTVYAATSIANDDKRQELRLHTFITGFPRVDHRNHNGLDNRRRNLRLATQQQNSWNTLPRNRVWLKGITLQRRLNGRPWQARIAHNGKQFHLGYFATAEEAATAYNNAAQRLYGEFARLNECAVPLTDNYVRDIVAKEVANNPSGMGRIIIATLSCGHRKQWLYYKRAKCGAYSHCSECKEVA